MIKMSLSLSLSTVSNQHPVNQSKNLLDIKLNVSFDLKCKNFITDLKGPKILKINQLFSTDYAKSSLINPKENVKTETF